MQCAVMSCSVAFVIHVCMYVCMYVRTYVCMYVCMYVPTYVRSIYACFSVSCTVVLLFFFFLLSFVTFFAAGGVAGRGVQRRKRKNGTDLCGLFAHSLGRRKQSNSGKSCDPRFGPAQERVVTRFHLMPFLRSCGGLAELSI